MKHGKEPLQEKRASVMAIGAMSIILTVRISARVAKIAESVVASDVTARTAKFQSPHSGC